MKLPLAFCATLALTLGCTTEAPPLYLHLFTGDQVVATARVRLGRHFSTAGLSGLIEHRGDGSRKRLRQLRGHWTLLPGALDPSLNFAWVFFNQF